MRIGIAIFSIAAAASGAGFREVASPAGPGSSSSFLSTDGRGNVLLSWIEGDAVRIATHDGQAWSTPVTVAANDLFVNWADFPSVVAAPGGPLLVHWLQKSGKSTYAYDVRFAISRDGGKTFGKPQLLNRDGKLVEHGFASIVPNGDRAFAAVWLDGRQMPEGKEEGEMSMRYAQIDDRGRISHDVVVDQRTCECCTTAAAAVPGGVVAAYRDRSPDDIRDISIARVMRGKAPRTAALHDDGWKIAGCPVNGPQIDARGNDVAVAWFTAALNHATVSVAFSANGGAKFGAPIRVDGGTPAGRVDVLLLPTGDALVLWMEGPGSAARVTVRRVNRSGRLGAIVPLATTSDARSAGFPRATLAGDKAWFTWTEPSTPKRVHIGVAGVDAF